MVIKKSVLEQIGYRDENIKYTGDLDISYKLAQIGKILHIDVDPAEIGKNAGPTIPLVGDAKHIFADLLVDVKIYPDGKKEILDMDELEEAFNNRWIDKYPNKNKRNGAYSTGSYDTIPYVLLNYTEKQIIIMEYDKEYSFVYTVIEDDIETVYNRLSDIATTGNVGEVFNHLGVRE